MLMLCRRLILAAALTLAIPGYGLAQDDDATPARLEDGSGRSLGRAAILTSPQMYGLYFKLWLDNGSRLRILRPTAEARRDAPAKFTFLEYRVDPREPNARGDEIGSGVAMLEPNKLTRDGSAASFSGTMQLTKKTVGDDEVPVTEPAQRFTIVLQ
jgi:hypothetical protein